MVPRFCSEQAEPAMFAVNHWQLDQNCCLPNDAVLCSIAAMPAAAGTACPGNLGSAGAVIHVGWSVRCGIALLEAVWAVQGLYCRCRWLYLPPRAGGTGRSLHGTQPPASLGLQQSLAVPPSKLPALTAQSRGGKNRPPPAKTAKESESRSLYSRNPEREGGAGLSSRRCL